MPQSFGYYQLSTSTAQGGTIPLAAQFQPGVPLDPVAATNAYLATLPADKRAASDAYFEGGYWIGLWDSLITIAIMVLLLRTGISRGMRNLSERRARWRPVQTFLYYAQFVVLTTLLAFPFTVYTGFIREHQYDLSTQNLGQWLGDQAKGLLVAVILGGLAVTALYGVVRRFPRTWTVWGAVVGVILATIGALIAPVFIVPLFNTVTPLTDERLREPILSLARANGIEANDVFVVDASKQSKRISANVSGVFGTMRITLNDNLLNRSTPESVRAVVGHEMGHYVLNHVYKFLMFLSIFIVVMFSFLQWAFGRAVGRWGERWGVRDIGDPAGLPVVVGILVVFTLVTGPLLTSFTRATEAEADMFGLNAAREPDGFAQAALLLSEYRKLDPGPIEEFIFFDHPSGRTRIYASMRWKAEHRADYTSSQILR
ncbi:MAG: M48 family metallopeptidase [Gemmatimonadaceae bacterium]|nr:M48 family metallopeptidase [Gemmatimonadaceae bacterium]